MVPISLDELVWGDRERAYGDLLGFLELDDEPAMREFFASQVSAEAAHRERWREGLAEADQEAIRERYEAALDRARGQGLPLRRGAAPRLRAGSRDGMTEPSRGLRRRRPGGHGGRPGA